MDSMVISVIDPVNAKVMTVTFTLEGTPYTLDLPFLDVVDATALTTQLQAFAKEVRGVIDAVKAAAAPAPVVVSPEVVALEGETLPVDA